MVRVLCTSRCFLVHFSQFDPPGRLDYGRQEVVLACCGAVTHPLAAGLASTPTSAHSTKLSIVSLYSHNSTYSQSMSRDKCRQFLSIGYSPRLQLGALVSFQVSPRCIKSTPTMGLGTIHRSVSRPVNCSMWSSCQISSSITSDRVEGLKQVPVLWNCQCNPVVDMCAHNVSIELSSSLGLHLNSSSSAWSIQ